MNALIKIEKKYIGGDEVRSVDARELHEFLGSETQFSKWISRRLVDAQLVEGYDFTVLSKNGYNLKGGRPAKEYFLSLDSAKHIAMMEKSEKGHQIRRYFIEVEKKARSISVSRFANDPLYQLTVNHLETEEKVKENQKQIQRIKDDLEYEERYYKVRAFIKMKGLRLSGEEMKTFGRRASMISKAWGRRIDKANCANFGKVNRYDIDVLEEVLKSWR